MPEFLKSDLADLENHNNPERLIKYINYFDENFTTILEYTETKKVFYEDYQRIKDNYEQLRIDLENYLEQISIPDGLNLFFFFDFHNLFHHTPKKIFLSEFRKTFPDLALDGLFDIGGTAVVDYQNDVKALVSDLKANPEKTYVFAFYAEERLNLLGEILRENEIDHRRIASFRELVPGVNLIRSENALSFGFLGKLEVFTEEEIFKRFKVPKAKFRSVIQHTEPISSKKDLKSAIMSSTTITESVAIWE